MRKKQIPAIKCYSKTVSLPQWVIEIMGENSTSIIKQLLFEKYKKEYKKHHEMQSKK